MASLLIRSWVVLAGMLALPFALLGSAHLTARLGGGDAAFLLFLLCVLSVYLSLGVGVVLLGGVAAFWLLGVINPGRKRLLLLLLLAGANVAASLVWMRVFVQHIRLRY
jgi:hypothetical protein